MTISLAKIEISLQGIDQRLKHHILLLNYLGSNIDFAPHRPFNSGASYLTSLSFISSSIEGHDNGTSF